MRRRSPGTTPSTRCWPATGVRSATSPPAVRFAASRRRGGPPQPDAACAAQGVGMSRANGSNGDRSTARQQRSGARATIVYTRHEGAHGGLPGLIVELPGERELKTNTILSIGEHSVRVEAFVCRKPDENSRASTASCSSATAGSTGWPTRWTTSATSIWSAGWRWSRSPPTESTGSSGRCSKPSTPTSNLAGLGFRTSIQKEWEWRVSRGESLKNLEAFEHLIEDDDAERE